MITIDQIIDALADFIQPFVDSAEIIRAQVNRVPFPNAPCVVLTELLTVDIDLPYMQQSATTQTADLKGSKRCDVQIDFYGEQAGDYCTKLMLAFRTGYAFDQFPSNIKPLYTSDGIQAPMISGEEQWQPRYTLTVSLQFNPSVTVNQQSAIELDATVYNPVDLWG
jgi:hypothetical protein